jgi:predicted ATPase/DNA-binding SARP family transcriptional activator
MEFRLLGRLQVVSGGRDLTPPRPKQRALLAMLLLREREAVANDELIAALWGERPPATAATALQGHVSELRKRLGPERIETVSPGYRLRLLEGDELDLRLFSELIDRATEGTPTERAATLGEALSLFRGESLEDFRYEAFAAEETARIEEVRLSAVEEQLATQLELGRHETAIPQLAALIKEHPYRERLREALMLALYRAGRQTDALNAFQDARSTLVDELGVEPGPALRELERRILNQDPALAALDTLGSPRGGVPAGGVATFLCISDADDLAVVRSIVGQRGGNEVEAYGSEQVCVFARARDAVAAALAIGRLQAGVRCGLHSTASSGREPGARGSSTVCRAAEPGQILVSLSTRELLAETPLQDVDLRDLGRHRLQDLSPPWRLFQLVGPGLADETSAPRSLASYRSNLPSIATTLVGRDAEIRELAESLMAPAPRLVTLTGPAGVGKTRLALQTAARLLDHFDDGVYVVDLAPLADPDAALQAVARAVDAPEGEGAPEERIAQHLRGRRALIVLDNLEHLLALASALGQTAEAIGESKLLGTSRVPLRLDTEREYKVEPLPMPDSVALFDVRARSAQPDFELSDANAAAVVTICRSLDGLPLAIELAASRIAILSPADLEQRLDERLRLLKRGPGETVERHRTLRAAIDWSYDLLGPDEQQLLAHASIFVGGFTLEALESVCGGELDAVDALATLVDASLVRQSGTDREPRFGLLETVREYAAERLQNVTGIDDIRRRHAQYFLEFAERAEPHAARWAAWGVGGEAPAGQIARAAP